MLEPQTAGAQVTDALIGAEVFDKDGERIGKLAEICVGSPGLALVKTGLFGLRASFVPLAGSTMEGDVLVVPFHKTQVREAPAMPKGEHRITHAQEAEVYRHYGVDRPAPHT
jgi:ribosomal 30S subunit maturation factor RimM